MLDQNRLQDFNANLDWMFLENKLKGSLYLDSDIYAYNWFWEDDWSDSKSLSQKEAEDENMLSGLDLSVEKEWQFVGTDLVSANYNHYTFVVTQRMLTVNKNGVFLV